MHPGLAKTSAGSPLKFSTNLSDRSEIAQLRNTLGKNDPHRELFNSVIFGNKDKPKLNFDRSPSKRLQMPTDINELLVDQERILGISTMFDKKQVNK